MADTTKIEWTDATWNIINGCSVHTPGCTNCYAMLLAGTRLANHPSRAGLTTSTKAGPVWNGTVRLYEPWLTQPLEWSKPRDIFVCAHGDLFHDAVTDAMLDKVFAVIALCAVEGREHRFQVLTKRSGNMRRYIGRLAERAHAIAEEVVYQHKRPMETGSAIMRMIERGPLPNVWLGVSTEDQRRADERIPDLLATPAAVRWISAEPLLGPIDLTMLHWEGLTNINVLTGAHGLNVPLEGSGGALDWVVVGGESGRGARPMDPAWARSLREQCAGAGVAFLFKQWGEWAPTGARTEEEGHSLAFVDRRGAQSFFQPDGVQVGRVGKKAAGRLLDGIQHDGVPA
jgi:protein gp37